MKSAAIVLLLAVIGESLGLAWFARIPVHPDFLLGIVVMVALARRSFAGALAGFCLGFFRDILYGHAAGLEAFPLAMIGWMVGSLGRSVYREALLTQFVVLFVAGLGKGVFTYVFQRGGELSGVFAYLIRVSTLSSLETALLVPLLYKAGTVIFFDDSWRRALMSGLRAYERKIFVKR